MSSLHLCTRLPGKTEEAGKKTGGKTADMPLSCWCCLSHVILSLSISCMMSETCDYIPRDVWDWPEYIKSVGI
jgi:hypothetical protein